MAVDPNEYVQSPGGLKPSRFANELTFWMQEMRQKLTAVLVQGGLTVGYWIAPWAGVIEKVRSTQLIAGGGGGAQNSITLSVGGTDCLLLAADGNTMLDNVVAGTSALTYPTDNLTACNDEVDRVQFNKGDTILLTGVAGAAALGTVQVEIEIAREYPADTV